MLEQWIARANKSLFISLLAMTLLPAIGCVGRSTKEFQEAVPGQPLWKTVRAVKVRETPELLARGKRLYDVRCAQCHGLQGDGRGPASLHLSTPPRDFRQGLYKFRTSPSGAVPTDEDLFRTVTAGFPAYGMPPFHYLPTEDRWAIIYYVKSFSKRFARQGEAETVAMEPPPEATAEILEQGREVFVRAQCGKCHGEDGRGVGPSAAGLQDEWGHPIRTLDLTSPEIYFKAGGRVEDIMRTLTTGLNGAPMPSYLESGFTESQLWSLAYYIEGLSHSAYGGKVK